MPTRPRGGDPDDTDDVATERLPANPSLFDRLRAGPRSSTSASTASPRTVKRVIERLDDRERWICFAASGLAVVIGVVIYVAETSDKHFRLSKGQLTPQTTLVIGLVTGVLLLVATLVGRRAPVGFVSLFVFLFFGTKYLAGFPFLVLAVWLLYRSYKFQKEAAATRRAAAGDGPGPAGRTRGSTARSDRAASARTGPKSATTRGAAARKGPATPEANKRFTPKRPPPPPVKPSRRERKAAQATE